MLHEDALEGSLWRYGGTDLADLYRDRLTVRQLWVRIQALPLDAPLWHAVRVAREQAAAGQEARDIDDVLAQFQAPSPQP